MRDGNLDKKKGKKQTKSDYGKCCVIPGCNKLLTDRIGPGKDTLCREHQLKMREYGGVGRLDRPHTFHRKQYCENESCGYNPYEDPKYDIFKKMDIDLFYRLCRNQLIGDHHDMRKSDGGEDTAANIKTLCLRCNGDKTILNEDYKIGTKTLLTCTTATSTISLVSEIKV